MADWGGAAKGAAKGAAVGSVVPGIGTAAGGVVGGIMGLFGGGDDRPRAPPPPPDPRQFWGGYEGGAEDDVARYREMGSRRTSAPWIDTRQSNQSRDEQYRGLGYQRQGLSSARDAMGIARGAALGQAPSAAEIYGQRMIDDSIASQMAMAASARGGPSALAGAQRAAAFQGAQMQQAGARDLAALRADEMARAREQYIGATANYGQQAGAYTGAAGGIRGQDFQHAYGQAGLEAGQRALDAQQERFYEQMAWDTRRQAQDAFIGKQRDNAEAWARQRDIALREEAADWGKVKDVAGMAASVAGMAAGLSDIRAKENIVPLGPIVRGDPYGSGEVYMPPAAGAPPAAAPSGFSRAMSVLSAGLRGFSGARPAYAPMPSDARAKYYYSDERTKDVLPLYEPPGKQLHQDAAGHAYLVDDASADDGRPSLAGPSRPAHLKSRESAPKASEPARAPEPRKMSYEELLRAAEELERRMRSEHETRMAQGPAVSPASDPMSAANRAQAGSVYTYRPEFAAVAGQAPGELNVGPMAQTMAADPIASTAVTRDPSTGLLSLDRDKLQKLQSAGIAHLQRKVDQLESQLYVPGRF